ncbi:MAG: hypothetical protein R3B81_01665 [bacterium]
MRTRVLAAFLAFQASAGATSAATLRVPSEYATINAALDASAAGDTVLVAPGTYSDAETRTVPFGQGTLTDTAIAFLRDGVVLRSEGGAAVTILDYAAVQNNTGGGIAVVGAGLVSGDCSVEGFSIIGDSASLAWAIRLGSQCRDFMVRECDIDGFDARPFSGAGVWHDGLEGTLRVESCVFRNCVGSGGGAVEVINLDLEIVDTYFEANRSIGGGGAIRADSDTGDFAVHHVWLERCTFVGNDGGFGGGAFGHGARAGYNEFRFVDCVEVPRNRGHILGYDLHPRRSPWQGSGIRRSSGMRRSGRSRSAATRLLM